MHVCLSVCEQTVGLRDFVVRTNGKVRPKDCAVIEGIKVSS